MIPKRVALSSFGSKFSIQFAMDADVKQFICLSLYHLFLFLQRLFFVVVVVCFVLFFLSILFIVRQVFLYMEPPQKISF